MGKNSGHDVPGLGQALRAVKTYGKQMNRERLADYGVATSANRAGQANLRRQLGRADADTRAVLSQTDARLGTLSRRAKQSARQVRASQAASVSRYGAALGESIAASYQPARGAARAGVLNAQGNVAEGAGIAQAGKTAMQIAAMGATAQGQAAQYAFAQALQQRTIIDNQTLASLTGDLYKSALEYNQQLSLMHEQAKIARKEAERTESQQAQSAAHALTGEAPAIAQEVLTELHDPDILDKIKSGEVNVTQWATTIANKYGYGPDEIPFISGTIRKTIAQGSTPDTWDVGAAAADTAKTLYGDLPGWHKWGPSAVSTIRNGVYSYTPPADSGGVRFDPHGVPGGGSVERAIQGFFGPVFSNWDSETNQWVWRSES